MGRKEEKRIKLKKKNLIAAMKLKFNRKFLREAW